MKANKRRHNKICLVTSSGGHLWQVYLLKKWWKQYDRCWVVPLKSDSKSLLRAERVYWAFYPEHRHLLNFIKNTLLAIKILWKERPDIIFSTGAGIAPPFYFIGKLLGSRLIFMETYDFIAQPTVSGRLVYWLTDRFLVQHKSQMRFYPRGVYWGKVI